jgi:lamin tail-like protein
MVPLAACSTLLGIQEPSTGSGSGSGTDSGIDGPITTGDRLTFNVGDFKLMMKQRARVHVTFTHDSGASEDVTASATYSSDSPLIVGANAGMIDSLDTQTGVATITASYQNAAVAKIKVTVKPIMCHPVINELQASSTASQDDEWVELYNPCTVAIDVDGWTLNYRSGGVSGAGAADAVQMVTLNDQITSQHQMIPGQVLLLASQTYAATTPDGKWMPTGGVLAAASGAVGLRSGPTTTGPLIDAVAYGAITGANPFIEGAPASALSAGMSVSRGPFDGKDDDTGMMDFKLAATPTPRAPNFP